MNDMSFWDLVGRASAGLASSAFLIASFYYSNVAPRLHDARQKYDLTELSQATVLARLALALVILLFPFAIAAGQLGDPAANTVALVSLLAMSMWASRHVWRSGTERGDRYAVLATAGGLGLLAIFAIMRGWSTNLFRPQIVVMECLAVLSLVFGLVWIIRGIHFVARHHAVFNGSATLAKRIEGAQRRVGESWERAKAAYEKIDAARHYLEPRLGTAVFEAKARRVEAKKSQFDERVRLIDDFSGAQLSFNLYEVEAFFDEVERLDEDLEDWTEAILQATAFPETPAQRNAPLPGIVE